MNSDVDSRTARPSPPRGVALLRTLRPVHTYAGLVLLVLIVISSLTGLLLGWKKNSETLQPATRTGSTAELREWRPFSEIADAASDALVRHPDGPGRPLALDRMDVRPGDGIVKVIFDGYWEVQVDGGTARALSVARRHSDWLEKLHDGSIVGDPFKLASTNVLGLGLLLLSASGLWMWYGPKRIRRRRGDGGAVRR